MTGEQLRAARALLKIGTRELAALANVDKMSIVGCENGRRTQAATLAKIRKALENAGIIFLGGREGEYQPTAALKWGVQPIGDASDIADNAKGKTGGRRLDSHAWDDDFDNAAPASHDPDFPPLPITDEMRDELREMLKHLDISPSGRAVLVRDFEL